MIIRLYLFIEVSAMIIMLYALHSRKIRASLYALIYMVLETVVMAAVSDGWISEYFTVFIYIGIGVLCILEFGDNIYQACCSTIIIIVVLSIIQLVGAVICMFFIGRSNISIWVNLSVNIFTLLIAILIYRTGKIGKLVKNIFNSGIWGRIIVILFLALGCVYFVFLKFSKVYSWNEVIPFVVFSVLLLGIILQWQNEKRIAEQRKRELEIYEKYNLLYKELIVEVRKRQHDFNNHLNVLLSMSCSCEDKESLERMQSAYCAELLKRNKSNMLLRENIPSVLAGFLYSKFSQAEENGIDVKYTLAISEVENTFSFIDLVEIIGNLFDNALEAAGKTESGKRSIMLDMEQYEGGLRICISNTCVNVNREDIDLFMKEGYSQKGEGHGLGLGNIQRIIQKYHGSFEMGLDDKISPAKVRVEVALQA